MPIIKSFSPTQNLTNYETFIVDNDPNSFYFGISELSETFTGGKNGFLIQGSEFLKPTTEVKIDIIDVQNNPVYYEPGDGIPEYYEGLSKLVSVHVYDDTPIGLGKITILGELDRYVDSAGNVKPIPPEWKGVYNVKWEQTIKINKNLANETIVRFVKRPTVTIDEIVKPIFTKDIPQITQTGSANGVAEIPVEGTNLTNYTAGTLYKINIVDDSNFTSSIDENVILFSSLGYSATVKEVLSNKSVLVDVPYTENNIVTNFQNQSFTSTYEYPPGSIIEESALTGSFAKIDFSNLKTFVGDVARVKVFRKSRNELGDFQLVQDSRLESVELLRDTTITSDTELTYGILQPSTFYDYWLTGSENHPIEFDDTILFSSVKFDYNNSFSDTQTLITSESFNISNDVEYTLKFKTLLSGSISNTKFLRAYFSGSNFTQSFVNLSPTPQYINRQDISENIISQYSGSAKLVLEFKGDDWYISNISLKNAQDTSFSPDEFTVIQEVPRKLPRETFDFRFEFYDINNNYIPVEVTATKEFTGGNTSDASTLTKFLTLETDRTAFRFTTGSIGNPEFQQILFKVTSNLLTGSVLYTSQAFDDTGSLLTSESYDGGQYPGFLTNLSNAGGTLTIGNFTGSRTDVTVGTIVYTASREDFQDFETVYRFEDGENAPNLFATSNANQFIYEPTTVSPKPPSQDIRIQVKRKNLASLITPITANSSSNAPLTEVSDVNGIKTYSITATQFSQSLFVGQDGPYDGVTYSFTASDEFNNPFSDEITISPVINIDGVSVVLSTENTSFRANSLGTVTSTEFNEGDGIVEVNVGEKSISHSNGLSTRNTFDLVSVTGTNVTPNSTSPTTNEYGVDVMSADSGSLDINITYLAGDNYTTQSFVKKVNYTKNRIAAPVISIETTNKSQTVSADSTGTQTGTFSDSIVSVKETYLGGTSGKTITSLTATSPDISSIVTNPGTGTITLNGRTLDSGSNSTIVSVTATITDTEGSTRTVTDTISLSKAKKGVPTVLTKTSPTTQTINSSSAGFEVPQDIEVVIQEGGVEYTYDATLSSNQTFSIISVSSGSSNGDGTITPVYGGYPEYNGTIGSASVNYVDSEGTLATNKLVRFDISVSKVGVDGQDGAPGAPGESGSNAVNITIAPSSQTVKLSTSLVYANPSPFTISVVEDGTPLTHTTNTTLANSEFKITNLTNGSLTAGSGTTTPDITPTTPSSVTGLTTTFDITYKTSAGVESSALPQSHIVSVVLDGNTGPGVVHTGIWESGRLYQFNDGLLSGTGRRDTVLWSSTGSPPYDTYYAATRSHTSATGDVADGAPNQGNSTAWVSLGQQDFFVAAKIGIFEDSFVQNTLNIGSNNNGGVSSANITLFGSGSNPYISIDQASTLGSQGYNQYGIFLGMADGRGKFSITSGSNFMRWNGDTLEIAGTITVTGGNAATNDALTSSLDTADSNALSFASGAVNLLANGGWVGGTGTFITATSISSPIIAGNAGYISSIFRVGQNGITLDGTNKKIFVGTGTYNNSNTPFYFASGSTDIFSLGDKLTWNGSTLGISGSITATAGNIGGWSIGASSLTGGDATLASSGNLTLGTSNDVVRLSADDLTYRLWTGHATAGSAPFRVTKAGALTATNATISGSIIAANITATNTGNIAGFNISSDKIQSSAGTLILRSNGEITGSAAQISGNITATNLTATNTGTIGGWSIGASSLTGGSATLASSGNLTLGTSNDVVRLSADDTTYRLWTGHATAGSAPFRVTKAGGLTATNATISGTITATAGTIGGFSITNNSISSSNEDLILLSNGVISGSLVFFDGGKIGGWDINTGGITKGGAPNAKGILSTTASDGIAFFAGANDTSGNGSVYLVRNNGQITGSAAQITGDITATYITATTAGNIGGFSITNNSISSSNEELILRSNGDITGSQVFFDGGKIGGFNISSDKIQSSAGTLILRSNGEITGSAAQISGNITATSGTIGGWDISPGLIESNGDHIGLVSSLNNNYIALGSTVNSYSSFPGIFMGIVGIGATDPKLSIRNSDNSKRLLWDGANLEIAAGNFSLNTSGDITATNANLSGTINATNGTFLGTISSTDGTIGGWNIDGSTLSSTVGSNTMVLDAGNGTIDIVSSTTDLTIRSGNLTTTAGSAGLTGGSAANILSSVLINDNNYSTYDGVTTYEYMGSVTLSASGLWTCSTTFQLGTCTISPQPGAEASPGYFLSVGVRLYTGYSNNTTPSGTIVHDTLIDSDLWSTGDGVVSLINSVSKTISINNTGTTTYYLYGYAQTQGRVTTSETLAITANVNQPASFTFNLGLDVVEVTSGGIQVTSATDEYVRIQKGASYKIDVYGNWRVKNGVNLTRIPIEDVNNDGMLLGIATNGDFFFAPIVSGTNTFSRELFYDQSLQRWTTDYDFRVGGTLSKAAGSFQIPHPLPHLSESKDLVHSFIEGPYADLIYRGTVNLFSGSAIVDIDEISNMTSGTFDALTTNVQCFTTNETSWDPVKGSISGSILNIECKNTSSSDSVSWLVIAERNDETIKNSTLTDKNGRVITEINSQNKEKDR